MPRAWEVPRLDLRDPSAWSRSTKRRVPEVSADGVEFALNAPDASVALELTSAPESGPSGDGAVGEHERALGCECRASWRDRRSEQRKTNTLAARVVRLVIAGADLQRILLLTFSRRAAAEMAKIIDDTRADSQLVGPTTDRYC
jgi:hypothetical protein